MKIIGDALKAIKSAISSDKPEDKFIYDITGEQIGTISDDGKITIEGKNFKNEFILDTDDGK
jgi:hypothetical protein